MSERLIEVRTQLFELSGQGVIRALSGCKECIRRGLARHDFGELLSQAYSLILGGLGCRPCVLNLAPHEIAA
jgi:hypothetical protein